MNKDLRCEMCGDSQEDDVTVKRRGDGQVACDSCVDLTEGVSDEEDFGDYEDMLDEEPDLKTKIGSNEDEYDAD